MSELVIETVPVKFTRRKSEFTKLQKSLSKVSTELVEFLMTQVRDTTLDPKVRQAAAMKLLEYEIRVNDLHNKDVLTRLLADIKYEDKLLGGKTSDDDDSGKSKKPLVDFDNIIEVEEIK